MFNIYCDESCHLENDNEKAMVIGSIKVPRDKVKEISTEIKKIKVRHGLTKHAEIKWTKISPSKLPLYEELVSYFFSNKNLTFRAIAIQDKQDLTHEVFDQTHDDWYYKMYYLMLRPIINYKDLHIYMDIKDTNSNEKTKALHRYLSRYNYDYNYEKITKMQLIRSEESQILQLVDLIIGAISYANRNLWGSDAKSRLVHQIKEASGSNLLVKSYYTEQKFNLFVWNPNFKGSQGGE